MMGIVMPKTCWASNKICNKNRLLHLVGILFPHINDDARSKSHQINWIQLTEFTVSIILDFLREHKQIQHQVWYCSLCVLWKQLQTLSAPTNCSILCIIYVTINLLLQVSEQIYSKINHIENTAFVGVELQNPLSRESTRIVQIFLDPGSKSAVVYLRMCVLLVLNSVLLRGVSGK